MSSTSSPMGGAALLARALHATGGATVAFSVFLAVTSLPDRATSIPGILLAGFGAGGLVAGLGSVLSHLIVLAELLREIHPRVADIAVAARRAAQAAETGAAVPDGRR